MFEAAPERQRSSATQLACYRAIAMAGRRPDYDLSKLALEMQNTRSPMVTEMQARGQGIGKSGAVTSLLRSLDRAIEIPGPCSSRRISRGSASA
jgi:hypothetical protein